MFSLAHYDLTGAKNSHQPGLGTRGDVERGHGVGFHFAQATTGARGKNEVCTLCTALCGAIATTILEWCYYQRHAQGTTVWWLSFGFSRVPGANRHTEMSIQCVGPASLFTSNHTMAPSALSCQFISAPKMLGPES